MKDDKKDKPVSRRWFQFSLFSALAAVTVAGIGFGVGTNQMRHEAWRKKLGKLEDKTSKPIGSIDFTILADADTHKDYQPHKLDIYNDRIVMTTEGKHRFVYPYNAPRDNVLNNDYGKHYIDTALHDLARDIVTLSCQPENPQPDSPYKPQQGKLALEGNVQANVKNYIPRLSLQVEGLSDEQLVAAHRSLVELAAEYNDKYGGRTPQEIINTKYLGSMNTIDFGNGLSLELCQPNTDDRHMLHGKNGKKLDLQEVMDAEMQRHMKTPEWKEAREAYLKAQEIKRKNLEGPSWEERTQPKEGEGRTIP